MVLSLSLDIRRVGRQTALVLMILLIGARSAHAYTDPGSGALLWQIGVAAIFGGLFYVKRALDWVQGRFSRNSADEPPA